MTECGLCHLPPRDGDNLQLVRVLPGQPHWDELAVNEPEDQTSVTVPVCYDCRRENAEDYFGLPPEMLGERPRGHVERMCRLCNLPARAGEYMSLLRIDASEDRYADFARNEPPEQTSISVYICPSCYKVEAPGFCERHGLKAVGRHLV